MFQVNLNCNLNIKRQVLVINSTAKDSNDVTQKDAHHSKQQIWNHNSIHNAYYQTFLFLGNNFEKKESFFLLIYFAFCLNFYKAGFEVKFTIQSLPTD